MARKGTFGELRRFLESLSFHSSRRATHMLFEHRPSDTLIVLRPYTAREGVAARDLDVVQTMLDQRGLMDWGEFDRVWQRAAGLTHQRR